MDRDPNAQGAVANHLRFKTPHERQQIPGADEYVEPAAAAVRVVRWSADG